MKTPQPLRQSFFESVSCHLAMEQMFNGVADIVYYIKDAQGRYMSVNDTLVSRSIFTTKDEVIGKTAQEAFPNNLGAVFSEQDQTIIKSGYGIRDRLELHLYANGSSGWCLTYKEPILGPNDKVVGLCGISRDIHKESTNEDFDQLSIVTDYIHRNFNQPLRLPALAEMAGLSVYQFDQRIRSIFHMTAGQYLVKVRVDAACMRLTHSKDSIAEIAESCGYSDQSAFSRQFKLAVGTSPLTYRKVFTSSK